MHAPPRLALLAALGLVALFPNLPVRGTVAASDHQDAELLTLNIEPIYPAGVSNLELDVALVSPGDPWNGPLTTYQPDQPLLLTRVRSATDVLLRSRDGLWAARSVLVNQTAQTPLIMRLEERGVLSGIVFDSSNQAMQCLVQAQAKDGTIYTAATSVDGTFRFAWLPEGKYELISPLTVNGRCKSSVNAIAGQEVHLRLQPQSTSEPETQVIGHVQSESGEYREPIRVKLWPLDSDAAPSDALVVWSETEEEGVSGSFVIPATQGKEYVLRLEKDDHLPTTYTYTTIQAPHSVEVYCDDRAPHTTLLIQPRYEDRPAQVEDFEVAVSWGSTVHWHSSLDGQCAITGVPTDTPVTWMLRSQGTTPVHGELELDPERPVHELNPSLLEGWGEIVRLVLPDGAPAANIQIDLDSQPAGRTDIDGLITLHQAQAPTHLSLHTEHLRFFGGSHSSRPLASLNDRDEFGRLLLVLLPRD